MSGYLYLPDSPCNSRESNTELSSVPLWPYLPSGPESPLTAVDFKQVLTQRSLDWYWFSSGWAENQAKALLCCLLCCLCCFGTLWREECVLCKWCYGGLIFCSILPLGGSRDWRNERREGSPGWKRRQRATGITRKYPGSKQHFMSQTYISCKKIPQ